MSILNFDDAPYSLSSSSPFFKSCAHNTYACICASCREPPIQYKPYTAYLVILIRNLYKFNKQKKPLRNAYFQEKDSIHRFSTSLNRGHFRFCQCGGRSKRILIRELKRAHEWIEIWWKNPIHFSNESGFFNFFENCWVFAQRIFKMCESLEPTESNVLLFLFVIMDFVAFTRSYACAVTIIYTWWYIYARNCFKLFTYIAMQPRPHVFVCFSVIK